MARLGDKKDILYVEAISREAFLREVATNWANNFRVS